MNKQSRVVIIGGGFAGARVAQELAKVGFTDITLIDRKAYFEVTYAALRSLARPDLGTRSRIPYNTFINGLFYQGTVNKLYPDQVILDDGTQLDFDIAVVASGSSYSAFPIAKSSAAMQLVEREAELDTAREDLSKAHNVLIVGGGIVGVELAGELAYHFPEKSVTLAQAGERLVPELKPKASSLAEKQLTALGVSVLNNTRLTKQDTLYQQADLVYMCVGVTPNTDLMKANFSNKLDAQGRIKVDRQFRMEGSQNIYALGDCANVPEGKLGYLADQQAGALAKNIIAMVNGKTQSYYKPNPMMSLVPIGEKKGFVQLPFAVTTLSFMVNMKQKDMFINKEYKTLGVKE